VHQKIDTGGLSFEVLTEDVETLNQWALEGRLDITKLSFPAFFRSLQQYTLLHAGSALGKGVGPLLIRNKDVTVTPDNIHTLPIAIPGIHTTANLLLSFAYPDALHKTAMIFSDIEEEVVNGHFPLGVIIHENRFTYASKGLVRVTDLGEYWEEKMKIPIPLGGIAIHQRIDPSIQQQVNQLIRQSLQYAFDHYPALPPYVKEHAQTMSEDVMRQHIELYVNAYSLDLGTEGRAAINQLHQVFLSMQGMTEEKEYHLFL
jgi:1,4-dihydroxy-6-naphthoate synthase